MLLSGYGVRGTGWQRTIQQGNFSTPDLRGDAEGLEMFFKSAHVFMVLLNELVGREEAETASGKGGSVP